MMLQGLHSLSMMFRGLHSLSKMLPGLLSLSMMLPGLLSLSLHNLRMMQGPLKLHMRGRTVPETKRENAQLGQIFENCFLDLQ